MEREELPNIALFISLRSTVRTASNRRGALQVAPIFDPDAVTPLDMWVLTKVAFHLNLPYKKREPSWYLVHCIVNGDGDFASESVVGLGSQVALGRVNLSEAIAR